MEMTAIMPTAAIAQASACNIQGLIAASHESAR